MNENAERGKKLTGMKAIAGFLGVERTTVWRWVQNPKAGAPIRKVGGRYFAFEAELVAWIGPVGRTI